MHESHVETFHLSPVSRGSSSNNSRSMHSMILDSIFEKENYGKGWLGYDIMPRASQAIFVELLVAASIATAVVLTPLLRKVVKKLWNERHITWHTPMLAGESNSRSTHSMVSNSNFESNISWHSLARVCATMLAVESNNCSMHSMVLIA